jgi:opacity protein-like surface antigen
VVASYRSFVAGAALILAGTASAAADSYPVMKSAPAPAYAQPASWYLRGDYGYAWIDGGELNAATAPFPGVSVDNAWGIGGGIGRYFARGFRGDITYEWRGTSDVHGSGGITTDFDFHSSVLLVNLYYDFRPFERFTPYIGVGLGAVHHRTSGGQVLTTCGTPCTFDGGKDWNAAGAFMAGLSFRIDHGQRAPVSIKDDVPVAAPGRLHIDVGYRFLYLGDVETGSVTGVTFATPGPRLEDVMAHEFRVGLRWDIR